MRVSVIIVNWNGLHLLPACLAALARQTRAADEIVVVDNGSEDGSQAWLQQQRFSGLKSVFLAENTGFSGGNNAGFKVATGDVIVLLNNDAEPEPDWLAEALPLLAAPDVGAVACKILRSDRKHIDKVGHLIFRDGQNRGRGTGLLDDGRFDTLEEVLWPDGCAAFYRRDALALCCGEAGLFDDDFFLYAEDAELGMRLRWAGYRCLYQPKAVVVHRHSASLGKFSARKLYYIERNRLWLVVKTFPLDWLLWVPLFSMVRHAANAWAILRGRGAAGGAAQEVGAVAMLAALLRAHWHALLKMPRMWTKRRHLVRKIDSRELKRVLHHHRISLRELTLQD